MTFEEWWNKTFAEDGGNGEQLLRAHARAAWFAAWEEAKRVYGFEFGKQVGGVHYQRGNDDGPP